MEEVTPLEDGHDRQWWSRVAAITCSAFVLRFLVIWFDTRHDPVVGDQLFYSAQAMANTDGRWFEQPFAQGIPAADHPPLTALVLTPVSWLIDSTAGQIGAQRLTMAVIGAIGIIGLAIAARRIAGHRVGLLAAAIASFYANLWLNDVVIMSEAIVVAIAGWLMVAVLDWQADSSTLRAALLALLAGLAALTRPELVVLVPVLFILVLRKRQPVATVSFLAVAAAVLLPWTAWNLVRFEDPTLLSTNDGITLAGGHCDEVYIDHPGGWSLSCAYAVPVPEGADPSVASTFMRRAAFDYWGEHIESYPRVAAARVARLLSVGYLQESVDVGAAEGRPTWASRGWASSSSGCS